MDGREEAEQKGLKTCILLFHTLHMSASGCVCSTHLFFGTVNASDYIRTVEE